MLRQAQHEALGAALTLLGTALTLSLKCVTHGDQPFIQQRLQARDQRQRQDAPLTDPLGVLR